MNKHLTTLLLVFLMSASLRAQSVQNIIIITTDGFRWQEVFEGMDAAIASQRKFNQGDSDGIYKKYWAASPQERRKKLLPFLWSEIEKNGQIYGNRNYGNNVNTYNPYWFSYPGYSEIFCGYADTLVNSNGYKNNPNTNVLEFINQKPAYKGKVAAFGAWDAFDRILNKQRSGLPVVAAFENCGGDRPDANEKLINAMLKDSYRPFGDEECLDVFTHYEALEKLKTQKPRVLYIAYGETDEWAHAGRYRDYLNAAHQFDNWVRQIWNTVQHDPQYKNKTALFITVDHGRGDKVKDEWTDHGSNVAGANQIWFAAMGPGIKPKGEMKNEVQIYQQQFAQTIATLLGLKFTANHPVAPAIDGL
ncbi:MAG: phosphoglyceromutase [Bacteroidetes bacterium]|nr:phosphoglyceromutase [Bacteroidota bacterium]